MANGTDTTQIECAGCGQVMISQKKSNDTSYHYDKRTGDLWHLECWEIHDEFMKTLEGVK
jgi:hypothetical protein